MARNVISDNHARWGRPGHVEFLHLDATTDDLPKTDFVIMREVFQHLSNTMVHAAIENMRAHHTHAIVSDGVAKRPFALNTDIANGVRRRVDVRSGVFLEAVPFNVHVLERRHAPVSRREIMRTLRVAL